MAARFAVLASGSGGNASLIQADGFGVLIDAGLGPRLLASRLAAVGAQWRQVGAVLLTHTHSDHWKDLTLAHLRRLGVPFYCHREHHAILRQYSPGFGSLQAAGLVRDFEEGQPIALAPGLVARALAVRHDSAATFGFRLEGRPGLFGPAWSLGYIADLGCWTEDLSEALDGVDVLALEFNHDERMERQSGRPAHLIARVLGDRGHLSNRQAAELVRRLADRAGPTGLRHLVQLHLSRACNEPGLAARVAKAALAASGSTAEVHTARQDRVGPVLPLEAAPPAKRPRAPV